MPAMLRDPFTVAEDEENNCANFVRASDFPIAETT